MWNLVKSEWKKIRLPVLASAFLLTTAACVLSTTLYKSYTLQYSLDAWEIGTEIFSLLFPLFVVMPLCWNLYYERRNNFMLYVLPRVPAKKYLGAKWLVYALSAFFILFVPYLLSALCALYIKPPVHLNASAGSAAFDHVFLNTFTQNPLLYALLLSCWKGIIGILVMSLGFVFSMYLKNIFVILTGPLSMLCWKTSYSPFSSWRSTAWLWPLNQPVFQVMPYLPEAFLRGLHYWLPQFFSLYFS